MAPTASKPATPERDSGTLQPSNGSPSNRSRLHRLDTPSRLSTPSSGNERREARVKTPSVVFEGLPTGSPPELPINDLLEASRNKVYNLQNLKRLREEEQKLLHKLGLNRTKSRAKRKRHEYSTSSSNSSPHKEEWVKPLKPKNIA
jgi:hypothetical protein